MSQDQVDAFLAKVKESPELQESLKKAADPKAVAEIAKSAGFDVSAAELIRYQASKVVELSDEELDQVSAGSSGTFSTSICCHSSWGSCSS